MRCNLCGRFRLTPDSGRGCLVPPALLLRPEGRSSQHRHSLENVGPTNFTECTIGGIPLLPFRSARSPVISLFPHSRGISGLRICNWTAPLGWNAGFFTSSESRPKSSIQWLSRFRVAIGHMADFARTTALRSLNGHCVRSWRTTALGRYR